MIEYSGPELAGFSGFSKSEICFKSAKKLVIGPEKFARAASIWKTFYSPLALTTFLALLKQISEFINLKKNSKSETLIE